MDSQSRGQEVGSGHNEELVDGSSLRRRRDGCGAGLRDAAIVDDRLPLDLAPLRQRLAGRHLDFLPAETGAQKTNFSFSKQIGPSCLLRLEEAWHPCCSLASFSGLKLDSFVAAPEKDYEITELRIADDNNT